MLNIAFAVSTLTKDSPRRACAGTGKAREHKFRALRCRVRVSNPLLSIGGKIVAGDPASGKILRRRLVVNPQLAEVSVRVVTAAAIVEAHLAIGWRPQVQITICRVIAVGLTVSVVTQEPWRSVLGHPAGLGRIVGIHRIARASPTAV